MRPHAYKELGGVLGTSLLLLGSNPLLAEEAVLSEVKVTGKSEAQEIRRNSAAGKLVFDRQELDTLDAASIGELLSKLPGAGMFADPDNSARGRARGPDRNMPQILVDGQPLPGGGRNPATALRLPVEMIERVEIIRNSTAEFPVLNSAGVINLVMRDVPPKQTRALKLGVGGVGGEPQFRLEGQYGQPDGDSGYLWSGSLTQRPDVGRREMNATTYSGGTPNGQISEDSSYSGKDTNLTLAPRYSWKLDGNQRFTLSPFLSHTENDRSTDLSRSTSGVPSRDLERDESRRTSGRLGAEWRVNGAQGAETTAKLILQGESENASKQSRKFGSGGVLTSSLQDRSERNESEWMGELRAKRLFLDNHVLTMAGELRGKSSEDTQQTSGSQNLYNKADLKENRQVLWVQDEWQLSERHLLTPGIRWTNLRTEIDDDKSGNIDRTFRAFDPSLHYLWQVTEQWNLRASIARNSRVPFSRELLPITRLSSGTNSSSNPDRGGNVNLAPERLRSIEAGVEHFLDDRAGTVGLSVFHRQVQNYTQRLTQEEAGRWVERPYNVGEAEQNGLVFDFKSKLTALGLPTLTLRGNAAYTQIKVLDKVPGLGAGEGPRKSANLGVDYEIPSVRLTMGGNYNFVSALDRESSATVKQLQGARRQLDLYALYKLDNQMALRFSAQNVTRENRRNYLTETDSSGALVRSEDSFTPGRATYMVTLESKW